MDHPINPLCSELNKLSQKAVLIKSPDAALLRDILEKLANCNSHNLLIIEKFFDENF